MTLLDKNCLGAALFHGFGHLVPDVNDSFRESGGGGVFFPQRSGIRQFDSFLYIFWFKEIYIRRYVSD